MGRLNFERRRELLFLFINLMRQLDILRYMWILYIECIAFIQAYDYLNLSVQCEQKFGSPVRQNLKQVNINQPWKNLLRFSNGNPFLYSRLEKLMGRGVWWATVHGSQRVEHNWTEWLTLSLFHLPYFTCWSPNPRSDQIRRQGLWKIQ